MQDKVPCDALAALRAHPAADAAGSVLLHGGSNTGARAPAKMRERDRITCVCERHSAFGGVKGTLIGTDTPRG